MTGICKPNCIGYLSLMGVSIKLHPNQIWFYEEVKPFKGKLYRLTHRNKLIILDLDKIRFENGFSIIKGAK